MRHHVGSHRTSLFIALLVGGCAGTAAPAGTVRTQNVSHKGCQPPVLGGGLELVVLGSGGPRSQGRAASSYIIAVDGVPRLMVDAGPGSFARAGDARLLLDRVDTYLLTHLHIDHAGELPGFVKSRNLSADEKLTFRFLGPSGQGKYPSTCSFIDRLFGKQGAFAYLPGFRNELEFACTDIPADVGEPVVSVIEDKDFKIWAVAVDHGDTPAVAYRIERDGRSIVISGDLASKAGNFAALAKGATVLVYDAAVLDPPGSPENLYDLHTSPKRIGEVAAEAKVSTLILSHLPGPPGDRVDNVVSSVKAAFKGEVVVAEDCLAVSTSR